MALDYAEKKFGIPREVIDGVLNIETQWGQRPDSMGKWPVVVRLYTLAVMRPDFQKPGWSEEQLITFLTIFQNSDLDELFSIKGSATGAFGLPQFEPTSYAKLAVHCSDDGDDDDPPDIFGNDDAICSIANYLSRAQWGTTEESHRRALFAYNHDNFYIAAILDYADELAGKPPKHPRYQFFHPQKTTLAATKGSGFFYLYPPAFITCTKRNRHRCRAFERSYAVARQRCLFLFVPTAGIEPATLAL